MASRSAPLETYVGRIINVAMAVASGWWAVQERSWLFGLLGVIFLVGVFRERDYHSVGRWWFSLLTNLAIVAWLISVWRPGAPWPYLLLVACILAQVVNLVLGRIQGIWRFQRPPEVIDLDRELGGLNK